MSSKLYWSSQVSEYLENTEKLLKSDKCSYSMLPSLYLHSEAGAGVSTFGKACADIISKYLKTSKNNFIELVFPASGNMNDLYRFLDGPRLQAIKDNRFYGVFLISLEECDDTTSYNFEFTKLLDFIRDNRENIQFIFSAPDNVPYVILRMLRRATEIVELNLSRPDELTSTVYVLENLSNFDISPECQEFIGAHIIPNILKNENYGFNTLNSIANTIIREITISDNDTISIDELEKIDSNFNKNNTFSSERRIGFGV